MQKSLSLRSVHTQKSFNNFVESVVDARRAGEKNFESNVVAETMKWLGNSSYGYQIKRISRHPLTKYLYDKNTHKAINEKLFMRLNNVSKELYKINLVKSKIEHREPLIVEFFILHYAKLRMFYYNCFNKFCNEDSIEELELDTDSLHLVLAHDILYNCIRPSKKA